MILYILIYSTFPFVEATTAALFKKICQCELVLPSEIRVSEATKKLIKHHLLTTSSDRFNASEIREYLERHFERIQRSSMMAVAAQQKDDQVVPDVDNQPTKLICQDPPSPKFDLSTENMSMVLKILSSPSQQESKMYLKPSLLAERGSNRIQISPQNSPSGSLGVTRNLTRQINNLSVRNRQQNPTLSSWHNRFGGMGVYEVRYRPSEASNSNPISSFESMYHTLNELFSNGSFPSTTIVNEFQGNINQDIALKLSIWLRTNFSDNPLVREIYMSSSPANNVEKFIEFLRRCHVEMEIINGQVYVKPQQTNQILIFLTYLLQLAGYNNNYFLNLSRSS